MQNIKKINNEINLTHNIHMLVQAYEEISVMRMKKIRNSVLNTRQFMEKVLEVFQEVKNSYKNQIIALAKKNKKLTDSLSVINKNNRTALILLSANSRLYGDLTYRVFNSFLTDVSSQDCDIFIIGLLGKELFDQKKLNKKYTYFDLPNISEFKTITAVSDILSKYKSTHVYYGKFESILNQKPFIGNISGDNSFSDNSSVYSQERFLFEPSLNEILIFFETQIFTSLFKQTIHESQLSLYASRITAMESALQNIDKAIKNLGQKKKKILVLNDNKKQQDRLAGRLVWSN